LKSLTQKRKKENLIRSYLREKKKKAGERVKGLTAIVNICGVGECPEKKES